MPYPGLGKMMRDNDRANARRDRDSGDAEHEASEAFTEEVACAVCGERAPGNQMFFSEKGQVCAQHQDA